MSPRAALDFLLKLTQQLFEYQTDNEQFQREKYLLVEESLYYGINDCEDRSIFLAWLIRDLLNLPVVALDYPGHVALAVQTQVKPGDDLVEHHGRKFVVIDPTYLGATTGMAMPSVSHHRPAIIPIEYRL